MGVVAENGAERPGLLAADVARDAEFVLRYRSEIERRMASGGVGTMAEAFALVERLRQALGGLSATELEWTRARVDRVIAQVEAHAAELATVRQLKRRIGE